MPKKKSVKQQIYENNGGGEAGRAAVKAYEEYIDQYSDMMSGMLKDKERNFYTPRNEKSSVTPVGMVEDDYSEDSFCISERNDRKDMEDRIFRKGRYTNYCKENKKGGG